VSAVSAFCSRCGGEATRRVPHGEDRERDVCLRCGAVHYQNPRVVVGTVVLHEGTVLLCRRAIEPRRGTWTLPGGFLEIGESASDGARRETREETGVEVRVVAPLVHLDIVRIGQIFMMFRAELTGPAPAEAAALDWHVRAESLEVRWFPWEAVPWDELAFDATRFTLERALEDQRAGRRRLHYGTLAPLPDHAGPWRATRLEDAWSIDLA